MSEQAPGWSYSPQGWRVINPPCADVADAAARHLGPASEFVKMADSETDQRTVIELSAAEPIRFEFPTEPDPRVEGGVVYLEGEAYALDTLQSVETSESVQAGQHRTVLAFDGHRVYTRLTHEQGCALLKQATQGPAPIERLESLEQQLAELRMQLDAQPAPTSPLSRRIERVATDPRGAWVMAWGMSLAAMLLGYVIGLVGGVAW